MGGCHHGRQWNVGTPSEAHCERSSIGWVASKTEPVGTGSCPVTLCPSGMRGCYGGDKLRGRSVADGRRGRRGQWRGVVW
jgi:hypothetical protein